MCPELRSAKVCHAAGQCSSWIAFFVFGACLETHESHNAKMKARAAVLVLATAFLCFVLPCCMGKRTAKDWSKVCVLR